MLDESTQGGGARRATQRPPRADEVPYCPPHYWIVEEGWEECRKCGERRQIQTPYQSIKIL
ncbi:MAG: hypothetical protein HY331_11195 [Chloroflexi bacterium]|nr:hypothetical protein [Chloroflexota bacterium]